jgi:hypothetical protein
MLKNIDELNQINKRLGEPLIKVEIKTMKATREVGVPQAIVHNIDFDLDTINSNNQKTVSNKLRWTSPKTHGL